ncbi:hypothetical protein HDU78_011239 [Chytriomyces hyalinus]|nr:hypothetical protein HDU78_011239 [Chytriomyces hyalinus]
MNLDPATFQVSYQMKILTTAVFSVLMLKKDSHASQVAVAGFTYFRNCARADSIGFLKKGLRNHGFAKYYWPDSRCNIACVLSGVAGVCFEGIEGIAMGLKYPIESDSGVSRRYSQLDVYFMDGAAIADNGFFEGYTAWTFGAISCQAIGGLIVALVVKYADNILKGFATSISIILSAIASVFLFEFHISAIFCVGSTIALYATHLYGLPDPIPIEYTKVKNTQDP